MEVIDRNLDRGRHAGKRARADGVSAVTAAKIAIEAAFDATAAHIDFKARVAARLAMGAADPANKARFGARAERLRGKSLGAATATVERWYKTERKAFQIASLFRRPARLPLTITAELRVMLRLLRRCGMDEQFPALIELLSGPVPSKRLTAAE